jgi:hypothetical protein
MEDTSFVVPEDRRDRVVAVHRRAGEKLEKVPSSIRFPETTPVNMIECFT